jgi:hypothetical protein
MENKILKCLLIVMLIIFSIYIPLALIFHNNLEILSILSSIFFFTFYSYGTFLFAILIHAILINKAELEKIEIKLIIGFISGNLFFIFLCLFFLANTSIFNVSELGLVFPIIGIVLVLFNGLIVTIFAIIRSKNLKKKYLS